MRDIIIAVLNTLDKVLEQGNIPDVPSEKINSVIIEVDAQKRDLFMKVITEDESKNTFLS